MNTLIYPESLITIDQKWPFSFYMNRLHLHAIYFNKLLFKDTDYLDCDIVLPDNLKQAINKRKTEYLAGRVCAKEALKSLGYNGYPKLNEKKQPIWPLGICGSISHSHEIAAAIAGKTTDWQSMGLDIEKKIEKQRCLKLFNTLLNQEEQQLLASNTDISLLTTIAFSVKESLFKALYPLTLQHFYFKHAQITGWNLEKQEIYLTLLTNLSTDWQIGAKFTGYFCEKQNYIWTLIAISR